MDVFRRPKAFLGTYIHHNFSLEQLLNTHSHFKLWMLCIYWIFLCLCCSNMKIDSLHSFMRLLIGGVTSNDTGILDCKKILQRNWNSFKTPSNNSWSDIQIHAHIQASKQLHFNKLYLTNYSWYVKFRMLQQLNEY